MFNRKPKDQSQHPKHAEAIVPDAPKPRALQRRGRSLTLDGTTYSQFPPRWRIFISAKTVDIKPNALSILPCEIRDLVWTFAVGGKVLHLWTEYPILSKIRVKARACLANEPQYFGRKIGMRCHTCLHQRFPRRVIGAVSLLQTCRQVYSEVVHILMTTNTFDVHSCVVSDIPLSMLPPRLNSMASLRFWWTLTESPSSPPPVRKQGEIAPTFRHRQRNFRSSQYEWLQTWDMLARMEGLRYLAIEIQFCRGDSVGWKRWEVEDFGAVKLVYRPKRIELIMCREPAERMAGRIGGFNCSVIDGAFETDDSIDTRGIAPYNRETPADMRSSR